MILSLLATHSAICHRPDGALRADGPRPRALLPGSFNPLHHGHTRLAAVAAARLGQEVAFELSVANVDKPELTNEEVVRRAAQFVGLAPVWVTRAATFAAKAELFLGATFVVGFDTAVRLASPRYHGDDEARRNATLGGLLDRGCRVVVGGRVDARGAFQTWNGAELPAHLGELFVPLTGADFRVDVSSTALRGG